MSDRFAEIVPVQLRGIGARSLTPEERRAVPVRIRTRGRLERSLDIREPRAVADLVSGLRRDVDGLPLTALVVWSGAGDRQAAFVKQLTNMLTDPLDALWIVAVNDPAAARATVGGAAVVLDLSNEGDRAICENLILDLLFAACDDSGDAAMLAQFTRRAPFMIVPEGAPGFVACGLAAATAGIPILEWQEKTASVTSPLPDTFWPSIMPSRSAETDAGWQTAIARHLGQVATLLTPRSDRRIRFRSLLKTIVATCGDGLVTNLIGLAHGAHWPGWAVETLPRRFVPTETVDGVVRAFTWSLLTHCVAAEIDVREQLCGGLVFEITIDEKTSEVLMELDQEIEKIVHQELVSGDGIFYVGVASVLQTYARTAHPVHAARMREISGRLESRRE